MNDKIYLFDTTLRDGQQTTGVNFTVSDKDIITKALDELGVDYIEGGWPGANPTDNQFFERDINFKKTFSNFRGNNLFAEVQNFDFKSVMPNSRLICFDHGGMRAGHEFRSPYLNSNLI